MRTVVTPLALLHGLVALLARFVAGVRMENHEGRDWDFFWQTLPRSALRDDLLASLWNLHAQPPALSLLGALLERLPGDAWLAQLQGVYVLLGCATTGLLAGPFLGVRQTGGTGEADYLQFYCLGSDGNDPRLPVRRRGKPSRRRMPVPRHPISHRHPSRHGGSRPRGRRR